MKTIHEAVYFFCDDLARDPVAAHVWAACAAILPLEPTSIEVEGRPVLEFRDESGNRFRMARTGAVISHDYAHYLPILIEQFAACDFAGVVNWHEGRHAPEQILTVHTTGDVPSGRFGPAQPLSMRRLLLAMEENRKRLGLDHFSTLTEATHWSGVPHGGDPGSIPSYPVPLVDIEIGSSPASWSNPRAAEAIARSLTRVFDRDEIVPRSLLCLGGVHFEPAFAEAIFRPDSTSPLAVSHILANQWLVGGYDGEEGIVKLMACAASIIGGVDAVVYHDGLKGPYKAQARLLAQRLGVPALKHQTLRKPVGSTP